MGTDSPGTEQRPQAPGGSCLGQGVLEPRAFPVPSQAGSGDSGLAAVTSCPYHVPLAWHCAPNCHGHWGWILGAQPHGRFSQRNWDWPWGRGHSLIVPVPPALGSSCAGAILHLSHLRHSLCPSLMSHSIGGMQMGVTKSGSALGGISPLSIIGSSPSCPWLTLGRLDEEGN